MLACEIVTGFLFTATPSPHGAALRENQHAGARKAECLPRLRGCGKTSEQILEKLAPATLTPIADMAAERARTSGTNPLRIN